MKPAFSRTGRLGGGAAASAALPTVTTHDPGARHVLSLLTESPELKAATSAFATAVLDYSQVDRPKLLHALERLVTQTRTVSSQIAQVHCDTENGRAGQRLAIQSLRQAEQAGGHLQAGLVTSDPEKIKADLTSAETTGTASQAAAAHAIRLLSE